MASFSSPPPKRAPPPKPNRGNGDTGPPAVAVGKAPPKLQPSLVPPEPPVMMHFQPSKALMNTLERKFQKTDLARIQARYPSLRRPPTTTVLQQPPPEILVNDTLQASLARIPPSAERPLYESLSLPRLPISTLKKENGLDQTLLLRAHSSPATRHSSSTPLKDLSSPVVRHTSSSSTPHKDLFSPASRVNITPHKNLSSAPKTAEKELHTRPATLHKDSIEKEEVFSVRYPTPPQKEPSPSSRSSTRKNSKDFDSLSRASQKAVERDVIDFAALQAGEDDESGNYQTRVSSDPDSVYFHQSTLRTSPATKSPSRQSPARQEWSEQSERAKLEIEWERLRQWNDALSKKDEDLSQALEEVMAEIAARDTEVEAKELDVSQERQRLQNWSEDLSMKEGDLQSRESDLFRREEDLERKERHLAKCLDSFIDDS